MYSDRKVIQQYALACLYYATDEVSNVNIPEPNDWARSNGWLVRTNECSWIHVKCDEIDGFDAVTKLNLDANNLSGEIPPELVLLKESLKRLNLSQNDNVNPEGTVAWIGDLTKLTYLNLRQGYFYNDGIPDSFKNLDQLLFFDVASTQFGGSFDPTLFEALSKLILLDISFLNFAGNVFPTAIGKLSALSVLYAENNFFSGNLDFLKLLKDFKDTDTETSPLEVVRVNGNSLTGSIPTEIGAFEIMKEIEIAYNQLSGTLPTELGELEALRILSVLSNDLIGQVPSEIGELASLDVFAIFFNDIDGEMPAEVCALVFDTSLPLTKEDVIVDCGAEANGFTCLEDCCTCFVGF